MNYNVSLSSKIFSPILSIFLVSVILYSCDEKVVEPNPDDNLPVDKIISSATSKSYSATLDGSQLVKGDEIGSYEMSVANNNISFTNLNIVNDDNFTNSTYEIYPSGLIDVKTDKEVELTGYYKPNTYSFRVGRMLFMKDINDYLLQSFFFKSDGEIGTVTNTIYDEMGNQLEHDIGSKDGSWSSKTLSEYNENGQLIKTSTYPSGILSKIILYEYIENIIHISEYDADGIQTTYTKSILFDNSSM